MGFSVLNVTQVSSTNREAVNGIVQFWTDDPKVQIVEEGQVIGEHGQFYESKLEGFSPTINVHESQDGTTLYSVSLVNWCRTETYESWIQLLDEMEVDYDVQSYEPNDDCFYMDDEIRSELQEQEEVTELDRILTQKIAAFRNA